MTNESRSDAPGESQGLDISGYEVIKHPTGLKASGSFMPCEYWLELKPKNPTPKEGDGR